MGSVHVHTFRPSPATLALTAAMVVMAVLVAGATWQALRAESSNRATAERTLHDYSAVAAWHFSRRANESLHNLGGPALASIDPGNGRRGDRLHHPALLLARDTAACAASEQLPSRFAFRIDLPQQTIVTAGEAPGDAALAELLEKVPPLMTPGGAERHRFVAPTIDGHAMRIAATLVQGAGDDGRSPTAIYGLAYDSAKLASTFTDILRQEDLLPPALVGRGEVHEKLFLSVRSPEGEVLYASGRNRPSAIVASDTTHPSQGRLIVQAALDPALVRALVIGGLPSSRLPALYALTVAAVVLTAAGLIQLKRERELIRLRSRFIANVSHQLRTPLAQISMFGETLMLDRARSEEERRHFASIITREARRLTAIIEKVLRFSRSEAASPSLQLEPRALAAELREATEHFAPLAAAAEVTLHLSVVELEVQADAGALRQIVVNLLENAVKYGPRGQAITVRATAAGEHALIAVEDQGPGIPRGDRGRVLEPFARLKRPDQPKVAGTGIGLAVVADLVRAHCGRLWIEDAPSGGARVCFTLALATAVEASASDPDTARTAAKLEADDDSWVSPEAH